MADNFLNLTGLQRFKQKLLEYIATLIASDTDYGLIKTNTPMSIYLDENGNLVVGGRLGQFPNGGVFYDGRGKKSKSRWKNFWDNGRCKHYL